MMKFEGSSYYKQVSANMKKSIALMVGEDVQSIDVDTFKAIQAVLGFIDAADLIIEEQENALKELNSKLDEIIKKLELK